MRQVLVGQLLDKNANGFANASVLNPHEKFWPTSDGAFKNAYICKRITALSFHVSKKLSALTFMMRAISCKRLALMRLVPLSYF